MTATTPERRERVAKLWLAAGGKLYREGGRPGDTPKPPRVTHDFAAALDAEADARVEAMRERCAMQCQTIAEARDRDGGWERSRQADLLFDIAKRIRTLPIKGSPT